MSTLNFVSSLAKSINKDKPLKTKDTKKQDQKETKKPEQKESKQAITTGKPGKKRFIHGNNIIMRRGTYKGYYGFVYEFYPSKFDVEIIIAGKPIKMTLMKNSIKDQKGNMVTIRNGPYANQSAKIVKKYPPQLIIYLDAINKKVSDHMIKEGNSYVTRPITPNDVFYLDIKLKNGKFFEVKDVLENDQFTGFEQDIKEQRTISKDDIESFQPGFRLMETKEQEQQEQQEEQVEQEFVSDELLSPVEKDVEPDEDDTERSEYETEFITDFGELEGEDQEQIKSTFKDIERITYKPQQLDQEELDIKNKIIRIIRTFGINEQDIQLYDLIAKCKYAIEKIKSITNQIQSLKNIWYITDNKYIIAVFVLYEIIQRGLIYMILNTSQNPITQIYVNKLLKIKYFIAMDRKNSMFLINGWSDAFNITSDVTEQTDKTLIHISLFENCTSVLQSLALIPTIDLEQLKQQRKVEMQELIPLGQRIVKEYAKPHVLISEMLKTGKIPAAAKSIIWGPIYQSILDQNKNILIKEINSDKSKTHKQVYQFVLDNIEQAPFVLRQMRIELSKSSSIPKLEKVKYQTLKHIWDLLWKDIVTFNKQRKSELERLTLERIERFAKRSIEPKDIVMSESEPEFDTKRKMEIDEDSLFGSDDDSDTEDSLVQPFEQMKISPKKRKF